MRRLLAILLGAQTLFWLGSLCLKRKKAHPKETGSQLRNSHDSDQSLFTQINSRQSRQPITFLRPIKSGVADLETTLNRFLRIAAPGDQILFGLTPDQTEEIRICESLIRSEILIKTLICDPAALPNPKVSKLAQMERHACHEIHLLLDAEAELDRELLAELLGKLTDQTVVTAFYGFPSAATAAQIADSLNSTCFLWAGTTWTRQFARQRFTFGACILFRCKHLARIGGWSTLGDFLGEDFHFGKQLADQGLRIELADLPLRLASDRHDWLTYFRHQLRVALTYRITNPLGYFGSLLVNTLPIFTVVILSGSPASKLLLLPLILFRGFINHHILQRLNAQPPVWKTLMITPICLATESATWLCSWFLTSVQWGARHYEVTRKGKLTTVSATKWRWDSAQGFIPGKRSPRDPSSKDERL
jgi:ceramide glucosyltransferase